MLMINKTSYGSAFYHIFDHLFLILISPEWKSLLSQPTNSLVLLAQTLISTIIILATAEYLPKIFFRINPNGLLKFFTIPISFFYFLYLSGYQAHYGYFKNSFESIFK